MLQFEETLNKHTSEQMKMCFDNKYLNVSLCKSQFHPLCCNRIKPNDWSLIQAPLRDPHEQRHGLKHGTTYWFPM